MTTVDQPVHDSHSHEDNYLTHGSGQGAWNTIKGWAFTLDHKRIGVMYLVAISVSFIIGGIFALAVRIEHLTPGYTLFDATTYNKVFTLHGAIMVFMFIIPSIPAALGNFVLPLMLGVKDVAFPRLNLASLYFWVAGTFFLVVALLAGGLDTGWTFYTPFSTAAEAAIGTNFKFAMIVSVFGAFILGFSSILTAVNFIATINMMRPKGMNWFRLPLFLWSLYATAVIQILATPVLAITLLFLIAESMGFIVLFDPNLGGDPIMYQHFFWFYSHPAVYIMILPAMGVISELISVHSRKHIFGYGFIAFSSIAIALFGFFVWGHHMFVSGQSNVATAIFSLLTYSVSIPSAIKVFNWLATMYKGAIAINTPMVYALGFIWLFVIGGLTGLFLASLGPDVHFHDTYFVVAHFHYVMVGGTLWALLGGLHHWWPKMSGKMYNEKVGIWSSLGLLVGFNITFFPQFFLGQLGMPRRYYYIPHPEVDGYAGMAEPWRADWYVWLHVLSTIGSIIMGIALVVIVIYLIHSAMKGKKATKNPWGVRTLDFATASPPIHHNFDEDMVSGDPYDYSDLKWDPKAESYVEVKENWGKTEEDE